MKGYKADVNKIRDAIEANLSYKVMRKDARGKPDNELGSFLNRVLCLYEEQVITDAICFLQARHWEIFSFMFDGIMVYASETTVDTTEMLAELNDYIQTTWANSEIEFIIKPIDNTAHIVVPDDYDHSETLHRIQEGDISYAAMKRRWETRDRGVKILTTASFFVQVGQRLVAYSNNQLLTAFGHLQAIPAGSKSDAPRPFISQWLQDPNMAVCNVVVETPDPREVAKGEFNIWEPYAVTRLSRDDFTYNQTAVDMWLDLAACCCNDEPEPLAFLIRFIAHLFQHPGHKAEVCPIISGSQGCGKDSLLKPIMALLGDSKYLTTEQPEHHVWGRFNHLLRGKKLVHVSELSYKNTRDYMDRIKGLITDENIAIKEEYKPHFVVAALQNYIILTNHEVPIELPPGQRRFVLNRCSNRYKNDADYWRTYHQLWSDRQNLLSLYDHLRTVADVPERFTESDLAFSTYHDNVRMDGIPPEEGFFRAWVCRMHRSHTGVLDISLKDLYHEFLEWYKDHYHTDRDFGNKRFANTVTRMKQDYPVAFPHKRKTNQGVVFTINVPALYTDLDCDRLPDAPILVPPIAGLEEPE